MDRYASSNALLKHITSPLSQGRSSQQLSAT
jgi:hypothetical protein